MQQAKAYADCQRFDVKYVFSTNGHRYGEFDCVTSLQGGPFPFPDFPPHPILSARYAKDTGIDITQPDVLRSLGKQEPVEIRCRSNELPQLLSQKFKS